MSAKPNHERPRAPVIWDAPAKRTRLGDTPLSRERIVASAIRLADEHGLDALSMRTVAADLDVAAMSLYRHVPKKDDLIELMRDAVLAELDLSAVPSGDWKAGLTVIADEQRAMALRHPWAIAPTPRPALGPNALNGFEIALSALDAVSIPLPQKAWITNVVEAFVRGAVEDEIAERDAPSRTGYTADAWRQAMAPYLAEIIGSNRYPRVSEFFKEIEPTDSQASFDEALQALLDGLDMLIQSRGETGGNAPRQIRSAR